MFSENGQIILWDAIYDRIVEFFQRESEIMAGRTSDPVPVKLLGFYQNANDYPTGSEYSRVFIGNADFKLWAREERVKESNSSIELLHMNSLDDFNSIIKVREPPFRLEYKNTYIVVKNVYNRDYIYAIKESYEWYSNRYNLEEKFNPDHFNIVILAFSKLYKLVDYKSSNPDRVRKSYIVNYPENTYAAVLQ